MNTDGGLDLDNYYRGVFHIHSEYSHDGHGTISEMSAKLKRDGIDFCVLTDHFEDFDPDAFQRYVAEIDSVNRLRQTVFVPAIEADFLGFHVIFLPVTGYDQIRTMVDEKRMEANELLGILAHPTKHCPSEVAALLRNHRLDGIELWNQQADGNYLPPAGRFRELIDVMPRDALSVVFGSDVHSIHHRINNLLLINRRRPLSPEFIVHSLRLRQFVNYSRKSRLCLPGNADCASIREWLDRAEGRTWSRPAVMQFARSSLQMLYRLLPRSTRHRINGFKNTVKNRL